MKRTLLLAVLTLSFAAVMPAAFSQQPATPAKPAAQAKPAAKSAAAGEAQHEVLNGNIREIEKARDFLDKAKGELAYHPDSAWGGHHEAAVKNIDEAIKNLQDAMAWIKQHEGEVTK